MRGDYQLPTGDWSSRDSLAEVTEIYERAEAPQGSAPMQLPPVMPQATQPSPVVVAPIAYIPMHRPMHLAMQPAMQPAMQRYEIPTIAPFAVGSSPQVRISERLDATHRVERTSSWQRIALIAGIVGAIVLGVTVGVVVSMGGTQIDPAPVVAAKPVMQGPIVTPIEVPPPAAKAVVAAEPQAIEPAPVVHHEARAPREARHDHAAPAIATTTGTLRISSKPPCAIAIDGKPSGKTTPQAALSLPVGSHQVTLTNEEQGIQLTTEVSIRADKPTSVVQDFTK